MPKKASDSDQLNGPPAMSGTSLTLRARRLGPPQRLARQAADLATSRGFASALVRPTPGAVVTFAGVQGGAGVSTLTLLTCGAVSHASDRPAVALDLASATRGGLGGLAGGWSQTSVERTAEHVLAGGTLMRPYIASNDGVHVISDEPQATIETDRLSRRLLADVAAASRHGGNDAQLAAIARACVEEAAPYELSDPAVQHDALSKLVQAARGPHSLVGVDLGLADGLLLERCGALTDLHVWVVAARREDLEVARRRLLSHEPVGARELVLAWLPDGQRVGARELRGLGEARGCSVARLPRFDRTATWGARQQDCQTALEALCSQLT